jgi:5-methylcytosine-specific restriction endonuclease McrA
MKKSDRQIVFEKYGGKCAYCGCDLTGKWCADHVEPIFRKRKMVGGYRNKTTGEFATNDTKVGESFFEEYEYQDYKPVADGCHKPELDTIENLMPSCFSCNHYKSTLPLEMFREQIGLLVGRLNKYTNQYKIAKRFGLVVEEAKSVVFYFEKF